MKTLLLLSLLTATAVVAAQQAPAPAPNQPKQQTPAPTSPTTPAKPATPATTKPAQPRPRTTAPRAEADGGRSGVAMVVTDMRGATLPGVHVELTGPTMRMGETNDGGQINFPGLQAGTYRLRFSHDAVTPFEREVTLRGGQVANLDITLTPAPPPKEIRVPAPAAAAPPAAPIGPTGEPQALSLYDLAEKELATKQPRREILISCSGNTRSTMVLLVSQDQPQRLYEKAEVSYYVLGGQGNIRVANADHMLAAGGYVAVPRGVPFAIMRRGRNPLSLLSVLSGEPCEQAK